MKITLESDIEIQTYLNFLANINQHKCPTLPTPAPVTYTQMSDNDPEGFQNLLTRLRAAKKKNHRIPAIKEMRGLFGLGLKDAKALVEALWDWKDGEDFAQK